MRVAERDELLYRLDERSRNTYHLVEKLERGQTIQNGNIQTALERTSKNTASITWIWRVFMMLGGSSAVGYGAYSIWG